ncbi:MAG: permease, partial [Anaerolineae bacterium]|nr:permease [Anaerolineae bacterium]
MQRTANQQRTTNLDHQSRQFIRRVLRWGAVLTALIVLALAVLGTGQSVDTILSIFATRFLGIFIEAIPFLLLGAVVSGLIDAFVTPDDIAHFVPRNPFLATIAGAFLGFAFPVCECGVVPVVRRLFNKGLPMWVGITFLLAAPVVNPIVLVSTAVAFGFGPVLIGRFVFTILVAVGVGLVFAFRARPQDILQPRSLMPIMGGSGHPAATIIKRKPLLQGLVDALRAANTEFFEMGRYLIIGSMLAATMQTFISQEVLLA